MAVKHPIIPFPFDSNRDYFGAWLSGFTDGEGNFYLGWIRLKTYPRPRACFTISLRADDINILESIRSYFGCGKPVNIANKKKSKPVATYQVNAISDCFNIICPHFTKFPLLAKKSGDFLIWKEAVAYLYAVSLRKGGNQYGRHKWTPDRMQQVDEYIAILRDERKFRHPVLSPPQDQEGQS